MNDDGLPSWRDTPTRRAIIDFVESIGDVSVEERVAVFDNDGTLWCEKPMPIELGFILERLAEMAEQDASLRGRQPWKAAPEKDYSWLGEAALTHAGFGAGLPNTYPTVQAAVETAGKDARWRTR